jgi:Mn2+/Fe2+ NRAMP family transporter
MADAAANATPVDPPPAAGAVAEPWSLGKLWRLLGSFGPAAVVASVSIGAGETIVVVRTGAWTGYGLMWLVLASVLVKGVCVTYLLGRYTAMSGELIGPRLARLPGPRGWLLVVLVFLELAAAGPLWAAIARPSGDLVGYLLFGPGPRLDLEARIIATLFIAAALGLSLTSSYKFIERQQLIICGVLVAGTVIGTALVRPDFGAALAGLFSFGNFPEVSAAAPAELRQDPLPLLAVTFGYVGGSVMTYLVYADFIAIHGWGMTGHPRIDEIRRRAAAGRPGDYLPRDSAGIAAVRRSIAPLKWDVAIGAAVLLVVTASFMMAGASVLFPRQASGELAGAFEGWSLLTDQASIWENIHPQLVWVYYVTVVAALWGTLQAYPDIYARGTVEYLRAIRPESRLRQGPVQLAICLYVFVVATAVVWSTLDFDLMTLTVAFLATNLSVAMAMIAALYLDAQLPPAYRTRWWMRAGGYLSAIILSTVAVVAGRILWQKLAAWMGT